MKKTEEGDSPLKVCRLTSLDEGIDDDGFLEIMDADAEVAALTNKSSSTTSAMSSLFNAPVINKKSHVSQDDDDTPVVRISIDYLESKKLMVESLYKRCISFNII